MANIRGGVFTRADARACGYRDDEIEYLLAGGGWRRIDRKVMAAERTLLAVDAEMLHLRRLHRVLSAEPGLVASHQSAVALHALPVWGLDLSRVHVTARGGRPGRHAGQVHRHVLPLTDEHVEFWNGMFVTTAPRAVAEVAATARRDAAVVVADAALRAGLATRAALADAVRGLGSRPVRAAAKSVLAGATGRSRAVGESRLRLLLRDAGLGEPSEHPPPISPAELEEHGGELWALWFAEQRTVVEFDPWLRYWSAFEEYDERPENCDRLDPAAILAQERAAPPTEHVWISWPDLDHPDLVTARVRTAFARAATRSRLATLPATATRTHPP